MILLTMIPRVEWVRALDERLSRSRESRGESRLEGREERELFCSISFWGRLSLVEEIKDWCKVTLRDGVVTRREGER